MDIWRNYSNTLAVYKHRLQVGYMLKWYIIPFHGSCIMHRSASTETSSSSYNGVQLLSCWTCNRGVLLLRILPCKTSSYTKMLDRNFIDFNQRMKHVECLPDEAV